MCDAEKYWFKYWRKKICLTLYSWTTVCVWNEGSLITELQFLAELSLLWINYVILIGCLLLHFVWNMNSYSKTSIYYHFGRNKSSNFCIYPFSIMFCHIGVWSSQETFCGVHVIYTWPFFFFFEGQVVLQSCARPDASDFLSSLCPRLLFVRAACVWEDSSVYFGCVLACMCMIQMYFFTQICIFVGS